MKKIVVLISGSGTNLQAIIDACEAGEINGEIYAVISNKASAYGLERAKKHSIAAHTIEHNQYPDRQSFDAELANTIDKYQPDLIVLAGFMRILSEGFVARYVGKMLNIHPSLLPKYPGLNTHQRAIDNGDSEHGVSIHFVTAELDGGPIVIQSKVNIEATDSVDSLQQKVAEKEWIIYPLVVKWFCSNELIFANEEVMLHGQKLANQGILYEANSENK